jgi:hypothetical protein
MAETRRISTLIESQLPEFISSEYENFSKVLEKYYEQLELRGQPLDVIQNITKYRDIDFYEKNLLNESTTLSSGVSASDTVINVVDATSFPETDGYIKIGNEILFYKERTATKFLEVSRGVSGNTKLGDLYEKSNFVTTLAEDHNSGDNVQNISNLFLYAIVKNFESDLLASFPEKYLKSGVDKRILIKNISSFYRAKGTDRSIKFIFNTLISNDKPEVIKPKDYTVKASNSDWITAYSLKVKVLSGDVKSIVGKQIVQSLDVFDSKIGYASGIVDNVYSIGRVDGQELYEIVIDTTTLNNEFSVAAKTKVTETFSPNYTKGDRINVFSTMGFDGVGKILIGNEVVTYSDKTVDQFIIESKTGNLGYNKGTNVYKFSTVECDGVKLLVLGVLYNLRPESISPYSEEGDVVQISDSGFVTRDAIIVDKTTNNPRWILSNSKAFSNNSVITSQINKLNADVSAIYEDENYYYICSSGYPSRAILKADTQETLSDQKLLRLIRKVPLTITESYQTTQRDVGIFVDGTLAFSHKDFDQVKFGSITKFNVTSKGSGYLDAPFVLINNIPSKARAIRAGETIDRVELLDDYSSYTQIPEVTITSGRGAKASAIVTFGAITSLNIIDSGEYYSTPPIVRIVDRLGKGRFAEYKAILDEGRVVGFETIDQGKFYSKGNVIVDIIPVGSGATATCDIKTWTKDRYRNLQSKLDSSNGYAFQNFNPTKGFGYGICANPSALRAELGDTGTNHSPILGFAYDGNPIYGPYGYSNPLDDSSAISRLSSGYRLNTNRIGGPTTDVYPLGTFIEDYTWTPSVNSGKLELDENNGRFCVTPEYPDGKYCYFVTVGITGNPAFPYILGEKYYSLPVDSNYNADLSQDDTPRNAVRLRTAEIENNGDNSIAIISATTSGEVSSVTVQSSPNTFKVGNKLVVSDKGSSGSGASGYVTEVTGKEVVSLTSKSLDPTNQYYNALVELISTCYLFEGDIITQESSDFTGRVISDISNSNTFVLDQTQGTFVEGEDLNSSSNIISLIIDRNASFSRNATLLLSDGEDDVLATGRILETSTNQNSVKLEVLSGEFFVPESARKSYFLQSTSLSDTVGAEVVTYSSLSKNLKAFSVKTNIALVETDEDHGVGVGSLVNVDIVPDTSLTSTNYYVRKRFYQEVTLRKPSFVSALNDDGVGRVSLLNGGVGYVVGNQQTYEVELVFFDQSKVRNNIGTFGDPNNARARVFVSDLDGSGFGSITSIEILDKGTGYIKGDLLTVVDRNPASNIDLTIPRNPLEISTQKLVLEVDHVGFAQNNTTLQLKQVNKLSQNDLLLIDSEIVKVVSINSNERTAVVERGQENTLIVDHFNNAPIQLYNGRYRFETDSRPLGTAINDPYIISYDENTQVATLAYNYDATNPRQVTQSTVFQDNSSPRKQISISSVKAGENKLEFSKDQNFSTYGVNTDIRIQKYYRYVFDTSHFSMNGVFLDFSASQTGSIFTEEKEVSGIQPGNAGSYVAITLGFGPNIPDKPRTKFPVNFDTYYYFIKASSDVSTDNASLKVIDDPISGPKKIIFSTPTRFAYEFDQTPDYIGTGEISYVTSSLAAIGKIHSIAIDNLGSNYKRIPIITGCRVASNYEAILDTKIDTLTGRISSISIIDGGKNYINPKAFVSNGDGSGAEFKVYSENGTVKRIDVVNSGSGFTYNPTVSIYEGSIKAFFNTNNIGKPSDVKIINNGGSFHKDKTLLSRFRSNYTLIVKNSELEFFDGERVEQRVNGTLIFSAIVANNGWRVGSNILRLEKVSGVPDTSILLKSVKDSSRFSEILDILYTDFTPDIRSYSDNIGRYKSDRGKIGDRNQKITDSYYYQDFSYSIKSKTSINVWRDLIKQTTHPAGFELFGEVLIEGSQKAEMPAEQPRSTSITYIELSPKVVASEYKQTRATTSVFRLQDTNLIRGVGSISVDEYDVEGIRTTELILEQPFNGRYASQEDYIGSLKAYTAIGPVGDAFAYTSYGSAIAVLEGEYTHSIKLKMVSNSTNTPPIPYYGQSGVIVSQVWDANDNINLLSNDRIVTNGSGKINFDLIDSITVGYLFGFGKFGTDSNEFVESQDIQFGALIKSTTSDPSLITSDFKVGDRVTFYENATRYVVCEVIDVDAPAYDPYEGVIGNGNLVGRRKFRLLDKKTGLPYFPYNNQELLITLNGVAQHPGVSFNVTGSDITFTEPPLGPTIAQTGENLDDVYESEEMKFICRAFKFKEASYNQRYLKKLRDISYQFDGITTEFDLYWEDGSIIKADQGEKFLVFINGVLQRAQEDEEKDLGVYSIANSKLGNAYRINRRPNPLEPDQIVFSEPPRNFYDVIDTVPEQLDQKEYFFGWGVGSYDRATINELLIPYRGAGPYLILGETDNKVKNLTDPEFALVFVNGVLQSTNEYVINGPNISFRGLLNKYTPESGPAVYDRVDIISLYGRDVPKSVTVYDYNRENLVNDIDIIVERVIDGPDSENDYQNWFIGYTAVKRPRYDSTLYVYTYRENGLKEIIGKVDIIDFLEFTDGVSVYASSGVDVRKLRVNVLNARNLPFENLEYDPRVDQSDDYTRIRELYFGFTTDLDNNYSLNTSNTYKISVSYRTDSDGNRLLSYDQSYFLRNNTRGFKAFEERYDIITDILPGDEIKFDGEKEFRKILALPEQIRSRNTGLDQTAKYDHYGKLEVTNYNGPTFGEGLSITTTISRGSVSSIGFSDIEWNRRDLQLFFDTGILLNPTAYQYYTAPQVKFISVDGNGGGAKASVIAVNGQILDVVLTDGGFGYTQAPKAIVTRGYYIKRRAQRVVSSSFDIKLNALRNIDSVISAQSEITISGAGSVNNIFSIITFGSLASTQVSGDDVITTHIWPKAETVGDQLRHNKTYTWTKRDPFTVVDQTVGAQNVEEEITIILDSVKGITSISESSTIGTNQITNIIARQVNTPEIHLREESRSAYGAFLDAPLSENGDIIYTRSTLLFPASGKLQVGKEIIFYWRKLEDRFYQLVRGEDNTTIQAHPAGQYFRTVPESVSVIGAGAQTIIESEVSIYKTLQSTRSLSTTIEVEHSVSTTESYINIESEIELEHKVLLTALTDIDVKSFHAPTVQSVKMSDERNIWITSNILPIRSIEQSTTTDLVLTSEFYVEIDRSDTNVLKDITAIVFSEGEGHQVIMNQEVQELQLISWVYSESKLEFEAVTDASVVLVNELHLLRDASVDDIKEDITTIVFSEGEGHQVIMNQEVQELQLISWVHSISEMEFEAVTDASVVLVNELHLLRDASVDDIKEDITSIVFSEGEGHQVIMNQEVQELQLISWVHSISEMEFEAVTDVSRLIINEFHITRNASITEVSKSVSIIPPTSVDTVTIPGISLTEVTVSARVEGITSENKLKSDVRSTTDIVLTQNLELEEEVLINVSAAITRVPPPFVNSVISSDERQIVITTSIITESESRTVATEVVIENDIVIESDVLLSVAQQQIVIIPPTSVESVSQFANAFADLIIGGINILHTVSSVTKTDVIETDTTVSLDNSNLISASTVEVAFTGLKSISTETSKATIDSLTIVDLEVEFETSVTRLASASVITLDIERQPIQALAQLPGILAGISGSAYEPTPKEYTFDISPGITLAGQTWIETVINASSGGITSGYSAAADLPYINGHRKPADVTLQKETGVLDFPVEDIVLGTIIPTRN